MRPRFDKRAAMDVIERLYPQGVEAWFIAQKIGCKTGWVEQAVLRMGLQYDRLERHKKRRELYAAALHKLIELDPELSILSAGDRAP